MKKIALITGAASGIGAAITRTLQLEVDMLLLLDRDHDALHDFVKQLSDTTRISVKKFIVDLTRIDLIQSFIDHLFEKSISPNIIINNAGFGGDFLQVDKINDCAWDNIFNVNVKSHFLFAKAFLPEMKKNKFGRIVNIASVQSFLGAVNSSAYVASKHAAVGLMKTIAAESGLFGVTCNSISPGYVNTKMGVQDHKISNHLVSVISKTPSSRIAEPMEIAGLVKYLLSPDASFINGENIVIDGGLTCHVGTQ